MLQKNITMLEENITSLKLINLCIYIDVKTMQKLKSLRGISFQNCTVHFMTSLQEDYDFYPKNLSRWSFDLGQTDSFDQFMIMINQLGRSLNKIQKYLHSFIFLFSLFKRPFQISSKIVKLFSTNFILQLFYSTQDAINFS